MNEFARFDEIPSRTLQDIQETERYGRSDNVKTVYRPQTQFAGSIITKKNDLRYIFSKGNTGQIGAMLRRFCI